MERVSSLEPGPDFEAGILQPGHGIGSPPAANLPSFSRRAIFSYPKPLWPFDFARRARCHP
jgi:hypothetical protein